MQRVGRTDEALEQLAWRQRLGDAELAPVHLMITAGDACPGNEEQRGAQHPLRDESARDVADPLALQNGHGRGFRERRTGPIQQNRDDGNAAENGRRERGDDGAWPRSSHAERAR